MSCCGGEVVLAPGVIPAGQTLMARAETAASIMDLTLYIKSGDRTPYQAWYFYQGWVRRRAGFNLAAFCCGNRHPHSYAACGKAPRSNHARGLAIDCGWLTPNGYRSFMLVPGALKVARAAGLRAPMWPPWSSRIEPWHMELA